MAIVKNNFRVSRLKGEVSPRSKESMSTDEDDELRRSKESLSASEFDDDDDEEEEEEGEEEEDEDADSGMDSDDVDLSELGEIGEELCQVGSQICSVPFELYDLPGLSEILSIDVWNECLTEEERFGLAKYLPDLEQDSFLRTMKELFTGGNFHFGSPLVKLFDMMKGGLCEPRVMLYQHGWNFFQKFRHYHFLRKYQNSMVGKFVQINNAWLSCKGYSIEERLRVLNLTRSQKSLMYDKREDMETDSSGREEVGDGLWARKKGRQAVYVGSPTVDASSQGWAMAPETEKYGKQNRKGMLQLTGSKVSSEDNLMGSYTSSQLVLDQKSRPYDSLSASVAGYDNRISRQGKTVPKGGYGDPLIGVPLSLRHDGIHSQPKNWNVHQIDEMKIERGSPEYTPRDSVKKGKYLDKYPQTSVEAQIYNGRNRTQPPMSKFIPGDGSFGNQNYRRIVPKEEAFSVMHQYEQGDWDIRGDKRKMQPEFLSNKNNVGLDTKARKYGSLHPQVNDMISRTGYGAVKSGKKIKRESLQNGYDMEVLSQSDETESDSSEQVDEGERANLLRSKPGYPSGVLERHGKTNKFSKKDKMYALAHPGAMYSGKSPKDDDRGDWLHSQDVEVYTIKGKQKSKILDPRYMHGYSTGILDESSLMEFDKMGGKRGYKAAKTDHMQSESGEKLHRNMLKGNASAKKKKGLVDNEYHVPQSSYARDYMDEDSDVHVTPSPSYLDDAMRNDRLGKKGHSYEAHGTDRHERPNMPLLECSSTSKKRKGKLDATHMSVLGDSEMYNSPQHQLDEPSSLRKRGKREPEMDSDSLAMLSSEKGLVDADADTKPGKKPFPLITPSIHTGFSFSIIHLLSAVRVAMVTPVAGDVSDIGRHIGSVDARQNGTHETVGGNPLAHSHDVMDSSISDQAGNKSLPSLTVQEIVNRLRSNPGDPSILETQEPLQDLVRGVLKIFSSKTAPLGAKGWKALVSYEKPTKSWSWIGPVTLTTSDDPDLIEEVTSYESWGLPYKMLVKLVDSFANWLKNGQETLQQIGSLPAPPLSLMQPNLDEKERFRDLRAQKSLTTISPSSEEVRAYFRREEILRYSVPDRAFSYTAADGRKSIVAPLRRGGGKPTSKARDHPILKPDRPPHVTILCLVRDAAARLPGSIGTRADVCTLIRDSQYIVEDVTDAQVNQVVSGALDRLHYERDPCVQFDGERKLWVYLHRDREEEDFEDDGTSSTKKWKRPRKDATEQTDSPLANVAYQGTGEQVSGGFGASYMLSDDLKAEPISTHAVDRMDPLIHGLRSNEDGSTGPFVGSEQSRLNQGHSMDWEVLGLNSLRENNMLCQENSTNEDYDDTFSRDRSAGLLGVNINNGVT